jgi:type VI secretion system ImpB/VipA family protein
MAPPKRPNERVVLEMKNKSGEPVKELPFITTILSDLFGDSEPEQHLDDRAPVEVRNDKQLRDLFDRLAPVLNIEIPDPDNPGKRIPIELKLKGGVNAFDPANVALAIEPLRAQLEARQRLKALRERLGRDRKLTEQFGAIASDPAAVRGFLEQIAAGDDLSSALGKAVAKLSEGK